MRKNKSNNSSYIAKYLTRSKIKYPPLTREEEPEIVKNAAGGNKQAQDRIIHSNLLLIVKIANEYNGVFSNIDDLVQEGTLGMIKAISKYDPSLNTRFNSYSGWWVRAFMLQYIFNNSHMIKPASTNEQRKLFYSLRKEQRKLESMGIDADNATIAINLNVDEEDVEIMNGRLRSDLYIDAPVIDDNNDAEGSSYYMPIVPEEHPDAIVEKNELNGILDKRIKEFGKRLRDKRHIEIFYKRIITDEKKETLQDLGDRMGLTKERVRQIEEQIVGKLKTYMERAI